MKGKGKKSHKRFKPIGEMRVANRPRGEGTTTNPYVKAAILEVVENQLRENDPPETKQTLERLLAAGYSRKVAVEMIGSAVTEEIWAVLFEEKTFDPVRYKAELDKLS